ncbi:Glycoside hydrolase 2 (Mannanase, beta-galactosidase) [Dimargaris cristalligena]|nr:Glycoside hydrolase 2 (Mannanase, beta-galactosidase) [Dimargaris cristalligena]
MDTQKNKTHRGRKTGGKAKKKSGTPGARGSNPKAFTFQSIGKTERRVQRNLEKDERRVHVPMMDRAPKVAPPAIVAVVGPPRSGKSTLIKSLVKRYTKQNLREIKGPITVVSGRRRRLTFIECSNDLNTMIDVAKIADLVLLTVDASYGFEMETFEFLNVLQTHGFPRVMGVLTHLDSFRDGKRLKLVKKTLKHRFWTEIYEGAKLFYISGVIGCRYPIREITNLSRYISIMDFRPLAWRNQHPYVLADRMEDLTDPALIHANPKVDRTVTLYGYLRGTNLKPNARVHLPGVGDFSLDDVSMLNDPCPLPEKQRKTLGTKQKLIYAPMADVGGLMYDKDAVYINVPGSFTRSAAIVPEPRQSDGSDESGSGSDGSASSGSEDEAGGDHAARDLGMRSLSKSRRKALSATQDAVIGKQGVGEKMVMGLQDATETFADLLEDSQLQIFSHSAPLRAGTIDQVESDDSDDDEGNSGPDEGDYSDADHGRGSQRIRRRFEGGSGADAPNPSDPGLTFADTDSELGDSDSDNGAGSASDEDGDVYLDGALRWKAGLAERAERNFTSVGRRVNLMDVVYRPELMQPTTVGSALQSSIDGATLSQSDDDDDDDSNDLFRPKYDQAAIQREATVADSCRVNPKPADLAEWDDEDTLNDLRSRFITGSAEDAANGGHKGPGEPGQDQAEADGEPGPAEQSDDELMGDFEDLEATGGRSDGDRDGEDGADDDSQDDAATVVDGSGDLAGEPADDAAARAAMARRKAELQKKFEVEFAGQYEGAEAGADEASGDPAVDDRLGLYGKIKADMERQAELNRAEFEDDDPHVQAQVEGHRAGTYVRVLIRNMPCEFVQYFNPRYPVVIGGLLASESSFGLIRVRIKRHRWHRKILKNNDPLIFSMGWRRFQTMPLFSIDDGARNRMLKYTPEHMHCLATIYGPVTPPGVGFCCVQSVGHDSQLNPGFRICATGTVLNIEQSTNVVKKLKLTGTPASIDHHSAIIKGMFHSPLEVVKFNGANIRTVSGIRGHIRKHLSSPAGHFRAKFEDKILMSDIVFLRAWYTVQPKKYYNPVTSLLLEPSKRKNGSNWVGMRLTRDVRRAELLSIPHKPDSVYRPVERKARQFKPLQIPRKLIEGLPARLKPQQVDYVPKTAMVSQRAVFREPKADRKAHQLKQMREVFEHTSAKRRAKKRETSAKESVEYRKAQKEKGERNKRKVKQIIKLKDIKERAQKGRHEK